MDLKFLSSPGSGLASQPVQGIAELQAIAPPGSTLTLKVLASQPIPAHDLPVKNLFEIIFSRDRQEYQVTSNRTFTPGDTVKVQISANGTLQLLQIIQAPPIITPQAAIQQGLREALPLQQSPTLLLNNLAALIATVDPKSIPAQLKPLYQQIDTLLKQQPGPQQLSNPQAIKQAFQANGSLLEAKLVAVLNSIQHSHPQIKTTDQLIQTIRQQPRLQAQMRTLIATDLKAQLLSLVKNIVPHTLGQTRQLPETAVQRTAIDAAISPTHQNTENQPAAGSRYLTRITALYQNFLPVSQNTVRGQPQIAVPATTITLSATGSSPVLPAEQPIESEKLTAALIGKVTLPGVKAAPTAAQYPGAGTSTSTNINTGASGRIAEPLMVHESGIDIRPRSAEPGVQAGARQRFATLSGANFEALSATMRAGNVGRAFATQHQAPPDGAPQQKPSPSPQFTATNPGPISRAADVPLPTITNESNLLSRIIMAALTMTTKSGGSAHSDAASTLQQPLLLHNLPINTGIQSLLQASISTSAGHRAPTAEAFDLAMSVILRQIAASLSRIQTHQLNSLGGRQTGVEGAGGQSWNLEIPVFAEGQFRPIQIQINEDSETQTANSTSKTRQWTITLGFDFEALGKFYATLRVVDTSVSTTFWSETPQTLQKIQGELDHLKKSLVDKGLQVDQLDCRQGIPPQRQTRLDQQLLDIKT